MNVKITDQVGFRYALVLGLTFVLGACGAAPDGASADDTLPAEENSRGSLAAGGESPELADDEAEVVRVASSLPAASSKNCVHVRYCNRNGYQECVRHCNAGCSVIEASDECRRDILRVCGNVRIRQRTNWTCN